MSSLIEVKHLKKYYNKGEIKALDDVSVNIERGDVIIDNRLYGQYAGEVQIALAPMKNSGKTNVVGHIDDCEHVLLDYLAAGTRFAFDIVG